MRILIQSWARLMLWSDVLYYITVPGYMIHETVPGTTRRYTAVSYGYIMITLKYDRVMLMAVTGKRAGNPTDDHIIPT
jgi:hypothetical protein